MLKEILFYQMKILALNVAFTHINWALYFFTREGVEKIGKKL